MDHISIVPLERQHLGRIEQWFEGKIADTLMGSPSLPVDEILSQSDRVRAWVALYDQEVVAVLIVSKSSQDTGYLSFAVHPGNRRQGWGNYIVERILNDQYISDLSRVRVSTELNNIAAQKILIKNGFINVGHNHEGHLEFERRL